MTNEPAIRCVGLGKHYGATHALADVDLDVAPGTIHALVGENGAGKSTCLGIIGGRVSPTSGAVSIFGKNLAHGDPRASRKAGIAVIYQELTISPHLSTQANVFLGNELRTHGLRRDYAMRAAFLGLCDQMGVKLPPDVAAGSLSVADQQLLEIQRALIADPRIILFDEPTASLAQHERDVLFRVMRDLRARHVTLALVSHNLDEVLAISDAVTVFRNGRKAASAPASSWTKPALVTEMIGHAVTDRPSATSSAPAYTDDSLPLISVRNLVVPGVLGPVDFEVRGGEILGVGGVVGSGRTTLLSALAGLVPKASGELEIDGIPQRWPTTVRHARAMGIALVPEDRQLAGLFTALSGTDNVTISNYTPLARSGVLVLRRMTRAARAATSPVGFEQRKLPEPASGLSGGNQQKLLLARWQHSPPRLLLCDEPTRGIDIGAKGEVMNSLRSLAEGGMAVVLVSSELEEIETNAHRAVVLAEGRQVGEVSRASGTLTAKNILSLAFRAEEAS
jgi:rhamnose transport system ATP-binding protein